MNTRKTVGIDKTSVISYNETQKTKEVIPMPLLYVRQDITKMHVDAIVNAANETLLGGGGVDGAIHRAAGSELLRECRGLGGCRTGEAKRTRGHKLPCKYVIHTVGPVWRGGNAGEEALLRACYENALRIAADSRCKSVAFPLISSGVYGYPKEDAMRVAVQSIRAFLQTHEMTVYLVLFDRAAVDAARERFVDLQQYIDDRSVHEIERRFARRNNLPPFSGGELRQNAGESSSAGEDVTFDGCVADDAFSADVCESAQASAPLPPSPAVPQAYAASCMPQYEKPKAKSRLSDRGKAKPLDDLLQQLDESFSEMLLRKIDEKGMTDAQCYKKANIDRKLFSKIRGNPQYKPSKATALAFAIALELPLPEVHEMLGKAGYALSHSSKFDVIVEYFIQNGDYDVFEINEALFAFDQNLLGA